MVRGNKILFIYLISLSFVACSKATPEIENLRSLTGFSLNQTTITVTNKMNPQFHLSGVCDSKFTDIEISFDGGTSWKRASDIANATSINCQSTGAFDLTFSNDISSMISVGSKAADGLWKFRAFSDLGYSGSLDLNLITTATTPGSSHLILAGSHSTVSGSYKLTGRVGGSLSVAAAGYKLKSTVKVR